MRRRLICCGNEAEQGSHTGDVSRRTRLYLISFTSYLLCRHVIKNIMSAIGKDISVLLKLLRGARREERGKRKIPKGDFR